MTGHSLAESPSSSNDHSIDEHHDGINEKAGLMNEYLTDIYDNVRHRNDLALVQDYARHIGRRITSNRPHELLLATARFITPRFFVEVWSAYRQPRIGVSAEVRPSDSHPQSLSQRTGGSSSIKCLDGLRGLACFFVFNFHFLYPWSRVILTGYGGPHPIYDGVTSNYLHQLPIVSLVYRGRAMVTIFFAISGYVLSRRPLLSIRSNDADAARKNLTSSAFRRALRLYLPPTVAMFLTMLVVCSGLFLSENAVYRLDTSPVPGFLLGRWEEHPPIHPSFSAQFADWREMWWDWGNPFRFDRFFSRYDPHTWTIPLEFRSSMILLMVLLGTAGMKSAWRMATTIGLAAYCLKMGRWEIAVFIGGMIVSEIDIVNGVFDNGNISDSVSGPSPDVLLKERSLRKSGSIVAKMAILLASLYVLSYPDEASEHAPGYMLLASYTPEAYPNQDSYLYWHSLCSLPLIWAITNLEFVRRIFEGRLLQYMGKISFSLYLVHGSILHSLAFRLLPAIWTALGYMGKKEIASQREIEGAVIDYGRGNASFLTGLLLGYVILLSLSIWIADIFWRAIDIPSSNWARKLEKFVSVRA